MDSISLIAAALGALVGGVLGMTGAGGAIIGVPLLVFGLSLSMAQAAPIALVAVALSASLGAIAGLRARLVRYRAAVLVAAVGAVVAPIGLWTAHRLSETLLVVLFSGVLAYVAFTAWRDARGVETTEGSAATPCVLNREAGRLGWNRPCALALTLAGASTGFLSGLLGVGGGFLIVPALSKTTDLSMQSVVATSLAVMALVSASAVLSAAVSGQIEWALAVPFAGGAVLGILAARTLAVRITGETIQKGFAVVAFAVAFGMALTLAF